MMKCCNVVCDFIIIGIVKNIIIKMKLQINVPEYIKKQKHHSLIMIQNEKNFIRFSTIFKYIYMN